jgi:hypothetical protein
MAFRLLICGSSVYVQKKRLYASSAPPSLSTSTCSLLAGACADTSLLLGVLSTVVVATDEDMLAAARQAKDGVLLVVTARRKSGTYRTCPLKVPSSLQVRWLDPESGPWPHILGPCAWRLLDCHSIHHAHLSSNLRIFHQYYSHRIKKTRKGRGVLHWRLLGFNTSDEYESIKIPPSWPRTLAPVVQKNSHIFPPNSSSRPRVWAPCSCILSLP